MNMMNIMYRQSLDCLEGLREWLKGVCDRVMWLDDGMGGRCEGGTN